MKIITSPHLTDLQKESVYKLWNDEYPQKLQYNHISEFEKYLNCLNDLRHYLLFDNKENIIAWAATFIRKDEKHFALIVNSIMHGYGYGTVILNQIKKDEHYLTGWMIDHNRDLKSNGEPYCSPLGFYLKNDFRVLKSTRLKNEKISAVKIVWKNIRL